MDDSFMDLRRSNQVPLVPQITDKRSDEEKGDMNRITQKRGNPLGENRSHLAAKTQARGTRLLRRGSLFSVARHWPAR